MKFKSKQAVLVEPGRFELCEVDRPTPGGGEILIRVAVCGLCNWELNHFRGRLGTCPQVLGHEVAGMVEAIGDGVTRFKMGDAVTGLPPRLGGFAEYCILNEKESARLTAGADVALALGEPLSCIVTTLQGAESSVGDVGVVLGCGPMGLWCIQALAGNLLSALVAVDLRPASLDLARQFGATHTLNPKEQDAAALLAAITDGTLADFVIEGTGHPAAMALAAQYLRTGRGRLILMSSHETAGPAFDWRPIQCKGAIIKASYPAFAIDQADNLRRAVGLYNRGVFQVKPLISHRFALDQIQQAFETLAAKPQGYLKGIVVP